TRAAATPGRSRPRSRPPARSGAARSTTSSTCSSGGRRAATSEDLRVLCRVVRSDPIDRVGSATDPINRVTTNGRLQGFCPPLLPRRVGIRPPELADDGALDLQRLHGAGLAVDDLAA